MSKRDICVFCDAKISGWGNNPEPLASPNRKCCGACNEALVLPARLMRLYARN